VNISYLYQHHLNCYYFQVCLGSEDNEEKCQVSMQKYSVVCFFKIVIYCQKLVKGFIVIIRERPGATVSFRLHPERRHFQPPPSPVVVILAASDPTYTVVHCWRSCVSGCRKPPLEQSAARRHLSFNAHCFSEPPQNLSLFPIIFFLTVFGF